MFAYLGFLIYLSNAAVNISGNSHLKTSLAKLLARKLARDDRRIESKGVPNALRFSKPLFCRFINVLLRS